MFYQTAWCHCRETIKPERKINPLPPSDAVRKQKKNILENLFSSVLSQLKQYFPSRNLKLNNLGIFGSLNLRILMEKKSSQFLLS